MSPSELTQRLELSFRTSRGLLNRLNTGLRERRTAWISARPESIAPASELEEIGVALNAEDESRRELVDKLAELLPLPPGVERDNAHVNVTRIAAAIPSVAANSLRRAADEATDAAKRVRRELALGRRLLGFAMRTHEGLMADVANGTQPSDTSGYDRTANTCRGIGNVGASLIDGRM